MIEADKPPPPEVKEELGFVGGNSSGFKLFWAFVMLVSGTLTTLSAKIQVRLLPDNLCILFK